MKYSRIRDLAEGAEPEEGDLQYLARSLRNVVESMPEPLGYLWRWTHYVDGSSPEWHYSRSWVKHPDIECIPVYDIPHMDVVEKIRVNWVKEEVRETSN